MILGNRCNCILNENVGKELGILTKAELLQWSSCNYANGMDLCNADKGYQHKLETYKEQNTLET